VRTVDEIRGELQRYEHPLFVFDADIGYGDEPRLLIRLRTPIDGVPVYRLPLHPRDLEGPQFPWSLQRMLYAALYDYMADMFLKTPQSREAPSAFPKDP
jgi:hypothetical protein